MVKQFSQRILLVLVVVYTVLSTAQAADFKIQKIEVEGNKRISFETIRSYLPVEVGDELTPSKVQEGIEKLYKTGFFRDVAFFEQGDGVLVIRVLERPSIADITIEGNELIKTEDMNMALDSQGVFLMILRWIGSFSICVVVIKIRGIMLRKWILK
jgi:outer membrane protein insertion porin family